MDLDSTPAKEILKIIEAAGKKGITKRQISRVITTAGCDCENWINTLLEAGEIIKCGKTKTGADLFRLAKW